VELQFANQFDSMIPSLVGKIWSQSITVHKAADIKTWFLKKNYLETAISCRKKWCCDLLWTKVFRDPIDFVLIGSISGTCDYSLIKTFKFNVTNLMFSAGVCQIKWIGICLNQTDGVLLSKTFNKGFNWLQEILRIIATSPKHMVRWKHELYKLRWLLRNNSCQTIFLKLSLNVPYQAMFQQNRIKKIGHHATTSHPLQSPDSYSTLFSLSLHFTGIKNCKCTSKYIYTCSQKISQSYPIYA